ncbi:hypothetical protein BC332_12746 [Capsicum chinense]|nr:hypothetical protein BC332_12746 [Capsicum chinense]
MDTLVVDNRSSFRQGEVSSPGIGVLLIGMPVTPFPVLKRFIRDLNKVLEIGPLARVFVYTCDQNDRVIVLYTRDDEQQADLAYDFDVSALANASDLNSDDEFEDESDSESENDDIEREEEDRDGMRRKKRRASSDPVKLFGKLKRDY